MAAERLFLTVMAVDSLSTPNLQSKQFRVQLFILQINVRQYLII